MHTVQALCWRGKSCGYAEFCVNESALSCLNTLKDATLLGCALRIEITDKEKFRGEKNWKR